ncbi:MAG: flagellar basal body-associated FliL family protein [Giesbergeria sp.]|mgnify:FL=1|nr:flagellar basal body-associated FliL family protein [Giesbergeria sp.]MDQ1260199.1 flagellar basal body-associated FliL family protein [Pseudomonadota bacterium]
MSSNAPADTAKKPAKSKKMLIIIGAVVLLLVVGGGGAFWFMKSKAHTEEGDDAPAKAAEPATPSVFLPLDMLVVNLADNGGERFAQLGITLELADLKTETLVKQNMPTIRNGVLLLASQRTAEELLTREGKEKLANDILREVSRPLGFEIPKAKPKPKDAEADEEEDRPRPKKSANPVRRVLFSSFIIQ